MFLIIFFVNYSFIFIEYYWSLMQAAPGLLLAPKALDENGANMLLDCFLARKHDTSFTAKYKTKAGAVRWSCTRYRFLPNKK